MRGTCAGYLSRKSSVYPHFLARSPMSTAIDAQPLLVDQTMCGYFPFTNWPENPHFPMVNRQGYARALLVRLPKTNQCWVFCDSANF